MPSAGQGLGTRVVNKVCLPVEMNVVLRDKLKCEESVVKTQGASSESKNGERSGTEGKHARQRTARGSSSRTCEEARVGEA